MTDLVEVNDHLGELEEELSKLRSATEEIGKARDAALRTGKAADRVLDLCKTVAATNTELAREAEKIIDTIQKVDFPSRLDKLDVTLSGMNIGVQNLQARQETLERNIRDEFERRDAALKAALKTNRVLIFIAILVAAATLIALLLH